jgi:hypothetical protein
MQNFMLFYSCCLDSVQLMLKPLQASSLASQPAPGELEKPLPQWRGWRKDDPPTCAAGAYRLDPADAGQHGYAANEVWACEAGPIRSIGSESNLNQKIVLDFCIDCVMISLHNRPGSAPGGYNESYSKVDRHRR